MTEKKKVLHVITSLLPDGAQSMLLKLCKFSDQSRFSHTVVSLGRERDLEQALSECGATVKVLEMPRSIPTVGGLYRLAKIVRDVRPHLIQGWMYHGNLAASLARCLGGVACPVFWNVRRALYHTRDDRPVTKIVLRLNALFSKTPQCILYNGEVMARQHEAYGFFGEHSAIVHNGFDFDALKLEPGAKQQLSQDLRVSETMLFIGSAGRFHKHKNQKDFITACGLLAGERDELYFLLVGRGNNWENEELVRWVKEAGITSRIHLLGARKDLPQILAGLDIFCSPSATEGFPNVIGEAMAVGVPCVVTDAGASAEIVGDTGVVVPREDPVRLAEGLAQLAGLDSDQRKQLGDKARQRAADKFRIQDIVRQYEQLYHQAIG